MKYFAFGHVVIECDDTMRLEEIVAKMRRVVNNNNFRPITIMIEDMEMVDEIDYQEYLNDINWGHFEGNNTGG